MPGLLRLLSSRLLWLLVTTLVVLSAGDALLARLFWFEALGYDAALACAGAVDARRPARVAGAARAVAARGRRPRPGGGRRPPRRRELGHGAALRLGPAVWPGRPGLRPRPRFLP